MRRTTLSIVTGILVAALPACNDEATSGSTPAFDLTGAWTAALVSDSDGEMSSFTTILESADEFGSLTGGPDTDLTAVCHPAQAARAYSFAGTLRGTELTASLRRTVTLMSPDAYVDLRTVLEFPNSDSGAGTYEVLDAAGTCAVRIGDTGAIQMQRVP